MARTSQVSKLKMWEQQDRKCFYCGELTILHKHRDGSPTPPNAATVDHVYPVNHPKRQKYKDKQIPSPRVIACSSCNNRRGDISFEKFQLMAAQRFEGETQNNHVLAIAQEKANVAKASIRIVRSSTWQARYKGFTKRRRK